MKTSLLQILLLAVIISATGFSQPKKIALHYSGSSGILDDKLMDKFTYWEIFLINNKIRYDVIYDKDLESVIPVKEYPLIIFPSTLTISDKAFNELIKFTQNGGSVLAFGDFLRYNEKLITTGWERFESLFGVRYAGRIPENIMSVSLDLADYSPLNISVNKLKDLKVTSKISPVVVEPLAINSTSIARFHFNLQSIMENEASAVMKMDGGSVKIWFSIGVSEIIGGTEDIVAFEKYILNSILMIRGDDFTWIDNIDNMKPSSAILFDLTKEIYHSEEIIKIVNEQNLNPGYIISENEIDTEILKSLSKKGELIVSLSSETLKTGSTSLEQEIILQDKLSFLSKIAGKGINSVFVSTNFINYKIIRLLKKYGIRNIFISSLNAYSGGYEGLNIIQISNANNFTFRNDFNSNVELASQQLRRLRFTDKIPVIVITVYSNCEENEIRNYGNYLKQLNRDGNNFIPIDTFLRWNEIKNVLQLSITLMDNKTLQITLDNKSSFNIGKIKLCFTSGIIGKNDLISIIIPGQDPDFIYSSSTGFAEYTLEYIQRKNTLKLDAKVK